MPSRRSFSSNRRFNSLTNSVNLSGSFSVAISLHSSRHRSPVMPSMRQAVYSEFPLTNCLTQYTPKRQQTPQLRHDHREVLCEVEQGTAGHLGRGSFPSLEEMSARCCTPGRRDSEQTANSRADSFTNRVAVARNSLASRQSSSHFRASGTGVLRKAVSLSPQIPALENPGTQGKGQRQKTHYGVGVSPVPSVPQR